MRICDEFFSFMNEYVDFFESVAVQEEEKLKLLYSRNVKALDEIFSRMQVTEKKIKEYEERRTTLHQKLGFENESLKGIIQIAQDDSDKSRLQELYSRLSKAVYSAKKFNQSSMEFAQMNLDIVNEVTSNGGVDSPYCYNKDGITADTNMIRKATLLNTQV